MLTYEDIPRGFNLASYFVDRNVEEGRGGRTALIGQDGATTYAELATLTNRSNARRAATRALATRPRIRTTATTRSRPRAAT